MKIKNLTEKLSGRHLLGFAVFAGIFIVIMMMSGREEPAPAKKKVEVNLLGNADVEKERWRAMAEKELETVKTQQKEIAEQLKVLTEQVKEKEKRPPEPPKGQPAQRDFPPIPSFPPLDLNRPEAQKPPAPSPQAPPQAARSIRVFLPEAGAASAKEPADAKKEEQIYLPSGSFISGVLLSGLDAPAGVNSSREPHPVLIKLTNLAVLPNRFRFGIKECFVTGEGYGDLSSERAYIRTVGLSCVRNDGNSIDVPLKGFVAGEDGKNGLRGRVVSKEGQIISKALLAGFAEGVSKAFSLSATTVAVSPLGTTQTVDPDRALEMGALTGVSRSADRLSQYYIRMAERIFPVIEIDAGRKVDVVVLQGRALQPIEEKTK